MHSDSEGNMKNNQALYKGLLIQYTGACVLEPILCVDGSIFIECNRKLT